MVTSIYSQDSCHKRTAGICHISKDIICKRTTPVSAAIELSVDSVLSNRKTRVNVRRKVIRISIGRWIGGSGGYDWDAGTAYEPVGIIGYTDVKRPVRDG